MMAAAAATSNTACVMIRRTRADSPNCEPSLKAIYPSIIQPHVNFGRLYCLGRLRWVKMLCLMARILITNDDGYFSDGIAALASALETVGEVTVVAPASEQSATAHSLTLTRPRRTRKIAE